MCQGTVDVAEKTLVETHRDAIDAACRDQNPTAALDALGALEKLKIDLNMLSVTQVGHALKRILKTPSLSAAHSSATKLRARWMSLLPPENPGSKRPSSAHTESPAGKRRKPAQPATKPPKPPQPTEAVAAHTTVKDYRAALVTQDKELYKDPPALPPRKVKVYDPQPEMVRARDGTLSAKDWPEFRPNLTPAEVLQLGSFGGTYFRPIVSAVTNVKYGREVISEFPSSWFKGLSIREQICARNYDKDVNKYGVKCGGSLGMWESSGWISPLDPYGWFQWYCRFYLGRRCSDDERQVQRWLKGHGPKGRFRAQLLNKIIAAGGDIDNYKVWWCDRWG